MSNITHVKASVSPELNNVECGYICTNCGMGWNGQYINSRPNKSCPDCSGELEFRENIHEL